MAGRAEFWSGHIAAQLASGGTRRAYCERHGLQPRNFRRWAQRSHSRDEGAIPAEAPVEAQAATGEVLSRPGAGDRTSTRTEGVPLPAPVPEVLVGPERRRRWTTEQKLELVMQTLAPGASLSLVARRYGVHSSVLFRWRRRFATRVPGAQGPVEPAGGTAPRLVPVRVVAAPLEAAHVPPESASPEPVAVPALRPVVEPPAPAMAIPAADGTVDGATAGRMEIELAGGARVRVDRHVDADALRRVLAALAGVGSAAP